MTAPVQPFGYFVHHQGRGHAERCLAICNALPAERPVTIFCARDDIFGPLRDGVEIVTIPSLFEPSGDEVSGTAYDMPDTVHCAPLGWPGIRTAMATMANWFASANPALMISDVSAEVAQLARICSVPHVKILQHGIRDDAGHRAAYDGALGLLCGFDRALAQDNWTPDMMAKMHFAGGLGVETPALNRAQARQKLGIAANEEVFVTVSGGGGTGFDEAPLAVGARAFPRTRWITIGKMEQAWHATRPANLQHHGWVDNPTDYFAAADLVIASTGNTTCQMILTAERPWIAVPEWRYFDEQVCKAQALGRAGLAHHLPAFPSHADGWRRAVHAARAGHDADAQRSAVSVNAAGETADWLEGLATSFWTGEAPVPAKMTDTPPVSVLTIARGRDEHLRNLVLGLSRQTVPPAELVIAAMQDEPYSGLPETDFPIHQILVSGDSLPLAQARNRVAAEASTDALIFLDVDCIPAPTLVADYAAHLSDGAGLLMGEVGYLPKGVAREGWTHDDLEAASVKHAERGGPPETPTEPCGDYRCFWSLNFAIHRADFDRSGGFDERYRGYGGEDTDFGRTLNERGVALHWVRGAKVHHQYHAHHMPPVQHIEDVLENAELFAEKWGFRTMDHWLYCFALMGLIEDGPDGLRLLRQPNDDDRAVSAQQADQPYASTNRVTQVLEERQRQAGHTHPSHFDTKRFLYRPVPVEAAE